MTRFLVSSLALLAGAALTAPVTAATDVGAATTSLLALQASGRVATLVAQPISGEVANRSYTRYLKSFEFPIPEKLGSTSAPGTTGGSSGSDSTSSTPR